MRFWDSSAVVPLLIAEPTTKALLAALTNDPAMLVWWGTEVECGSAIARLERDGELDEPAAHKAFERLQQFAGAWHEVDPSDGIRESAVRFLRVHPLRAADALQLAAAYIAAERRPPSLDIVTLDDHLAAAARKEGFRLVKIAAAEG